MSGEERMLQGGRKALKFTQSQKNGIKSLQRSVISHFLVNFALDFEKKWHKRAS
jgi:hypothetical protein